MVVCPLPVCAHEGAQCLDLFGIEKVVAQEQPWDSTVVDLDTPPAARLVARPRTLQLRERILEQLRV
jgi:hypothetical protein